MLATALPELAMLVSLFVFAIGGIGPIRVDADVIMMMLVTEAMTMLGFATLVDIATRLGKPLPVWLAVLVAVGVLVLNGQFIYAFEMAWSQGAWVFILFAWSVLERIRELWTMPSASRMEKIRRRTLVFDRLYIGVHMIWLGAAVAGVILLSGVEFGFSDPRLLVVIGAAFYGLATFNAVRVHRARFAEQPSSLMPWFDKGDATYLDPL